MPLTVASSPCLSKLESVDSEGDSILERAIDFVPASLDVSKVQSCYGISQGCSIVINRADRWDSELDEPHGGFDEASVDRMRLNFDPESLLADGEIF